MKQLKIFHSTILIEARNSLSDVSDSSEPPQTATQLGAFKIQIYWTCSMICCNDLNKSGVSAPPPPHSDILVHWSGIWLRFLVCLFSLHMHTDCQETRDSGKLHNLHISLFKQHLFSNDRSTLRGEWESIFNWMFTWGITSTIWIRLLDHMHVDASSGLLSCWSISKRTHKTVQRRNKSCFKSHKDHHISPSKTMVKTGT